MKAGFLDRLVERVSRLDPGSLQTHFLQLAREKGLLETILQAVREGVIVLDGKGCITYANRAAEGLLGFSRETAEGAPIRRYLRGIEWDLVLDLDESEWSKMVSREIETSYPRHRFLDFYVVPLGLVKPGEQGAVVILRDVTQEREHESHALESERLHAVTLLAAGVAHEIGNPLNSLNIHLQLLDREIQTLAEKDRERLAELLGIAKQEVTRLDGIIRQFLHAVRPARPQLESANLAELLDETLKFMKAEIEERGVWVEVDAEENLPAVQVDRGQVRQAFFNIIKNAAEASPGGGVLKISLSSTDRFVATAFKDSGTGIPAGELGAIFEPYQTTKREGTGLGLMIVQRVVRDHGGQLEVDSEPDRGTTVTVFLPREDARIRLLKAHRPGETAAAEHIP